MSCDKCQYTISTLRRNSRTELCLVFLTKIFAIPLIAIYSCSILNFFFNLLTHFLHKMPIFILDCPRGWVSDSSNCYKFVDNDPLIFEEADAACWVSLFQFQRPVLHEHLQTILSEMRQR